MNFWFQFMMKNHRGNKDFVLREENCGPHGAKSNAKYLREKAVGRLKQPEQSQNLNLIENA